MPIRTGSLTLSCCGLLPAEGSRPGRDARAPVTAEHFAAAAMHSDRTPYFFAAHAYCCEVEDGAVILDLRSGNYIGVDADYLPNLRQEVQNWPHTTAGDSRSRYRSRRDTGNLISDLVDRGVIVIHPVEQRSYFPLISLVELRSGVGILDPPPLALRDPADFLLAWLNARLRTKDTKLGSLLERIDRGQRQIQDGTTAVSLDEVRTVMERFIRLRLWCYTAAQHCLFDSAVLAGFLTRRRIPCTFLIGVSTKPFAAHAWIQFGAYVLNDTVEHVQLFTPILQIGHQA